MAAGVLGINGLGRIGKLTLWYESTSDRFDHLVVNMGRQGGRGLEDVAHYISADSTYGPVHRFLNGFLAKPCVQIVNRERQELMVNGKRVTLLSMDRNPADIRWRDHGVPIVVDTTGKFRDPTKPADDKKGSLRGHIEAGARVVIASAPFKLADKSAKMPDDAVMLIQGINHDAFEPTRHNVIAAASCTTTALGHMMLPLLSHERTRNMLTASMSTIHASTNSQSVLDKPPAAGASDLRKNRSILNNIILTSTGAARALEQVIPEIAKIGFMADSVRIPTTTASLIVLNCTFQSKLDDVGNSLINHTMVNDLYRRFAEVPGSGLAYSESQNVSTDMIGHPAAVVIEGVETHTRTGFACLDLEQLAPDLNLPNKQIEIAVTHLKAFGWYDNELGSYTKRMCELVDHVADRVA